MKKLIIAICAVMVTIAASAKLLCVYSSFDVTFKVNLDVPLDNPPFNGGATIDVVGDESGVYVSSTLPAEVLFENVEHIAEITAISVDFLGHVKPSSMTGSGSCYEYEANSLAQAVRMFVQFARDSK